MTQTQHIAHPIRRSKISRTLAVIAAVTFVAANAASPAQAASSKTLKPAEAIKIFDKAYKNTEKLVAKGAYQRTKTELDRGKTTYNNEIAVDKNGNGKQYTSGAGAEIYIGDVVYLSTGEHVYEKYELDIARELGMNINLPWAVIDAVAASPEYVKGNFVADLRSGSLPETWLFRSLPNDKGARSTVHYRKSASTEYLSYTVTDSFKNKTNATVTIAGGIITGIVIDYGQGTISSMTYRVYKETLKAPAGPYVEWMKIYNDPRFIQGKAGDIARAEVAAITRSAEASAAFAGHNEITAADWKSALATENAVLYDKGFELEISMSTSTGYKQVTACATFGPTGATVDVKSCSSLGYTKS